MRKALITGVTGQDGAYLSSFLLDKGYEVHGIMRRASVFTTERIEHLRNNPNFHLHHGDLADSSNLHHLVNAIWPDEVYNLGAQSHVGVSFEVPEYTADVDAIGTLRLLEAVRDAGKGVRFYQASTSEMFGGFPETVPQSETTPFHPRSPYGVAKLYGYWTAVNYRESYDLFVSNGILFNHESPLRGETFLTRKVTKAVAKLYLTGDETPLRVGNLSALRDWGYAPEYVQAMWLMLQQKKPDDFVIATGRATSVKDFIELAYKNINVQLHWVEEDGKITHALSSVTGNKIVEVDPSYFRPSEVPYLLGDASKAERLMGWTPQTNVERLCEIMVEADISSMLEGI